MITKRIIPCLDVKEGRVVKGIQFLELKDAGDPVELAEVYDREGADELVFLDISASHEGRKTMVDVVEQVAAKLAIPFTVARHQSAQRYENDTACRSGQSVGEHGSCSPPRADCRRSRVFRFSMHRSCH